MKDVMTSHRLAVRGPLVIAIVAVLLGQSIETGDLAHYRTREPIHTSSFGKDRSRKEAEARAFLWDNWHQRRRAHLVKTFVTIEGEENVFEFFVEPDSHGAWKIEVKVDRQRFSRDIHSPKQWREKDAFTCTALERVKSPADLLRPLVAIPAEADRLPTTYRLHPVCGPERNLPTLW
jgi:hypothetical protein